MTVSKDDIRVGPIQKDSDSLRYCAGEVKIIGIQIAVNLPGCSLKSLVQAIGGTVIKLVDYDEACPIFFENLGRIVSGARIDHNVFDIRVILLQYRLYCTFQKLTLIKSVRYD